MAYVTVKLEPETVTFLDSKVMETFLSHHPELRRARVSRPMLIAAALNYYVKKKHTVLDALLWGPKP